MVSEIPKITCDGGTEDDLNIQLPTVTIYPNPSNGNFKIDVGITQFDEAYFVLYNTAGHQMMPKIFFTENQQSFTYPNLPIGLYYVNLVFDEKVVRKKLMITHY